MAMVACTILTDIQGMAPYMMIIMATAFGAAVAEARAHGRVLAQVVVPVVMVALVALAPVHALVVAEVVAHQVEVPAGLEVAVIPAVVLEAAAVRVVMVAVVTDNFAKAACFKV